MFIMSPLLSASALVALGVVSAKGGAEATRSLDSGIELPLPEPPVAETVKSPFKGKAKWTMYYVVDVKAPAKTGSGTGKTVELLDGSKVNYFWSKSEISKMRMEATALIVDIDGSQQPITRVGPGRWQAIPADHYSKGNRGNMLYPWVHVAADQSIYRKRPSEHRLKGVSRWRGVMKVDACLNHHSQKLRSGNGWGCSRTMIGVRPSSAGSFRCRMGDS
jgi:hypothetical protein